MDFYYRDVCIFQITNKNAKNNVIKLSIESLLLGGEGGGEAVG